MKKISLNKKQRELIKAVLIKAIANCNRPLNVVEVDKDTMYVQLARIEGNSPNVIVELTPTKTQKKGIVT